MNVLETERLLLRPLTWDDLDELVTLYADPEVMRWLGGLRSRAETEEWLRERGLAHFERYGYGVYATIQKTDGRFVGRCGLIHQEVDGQDELEIAYTIVRASWGQGFATEAARALRDYGFQQLGRKRLISLILPANVASQQVARKNGMVYEKDTVFRGYPSRVYAIHSDPSGS